MKFRFWSLAVFESWVLGAWSLLAAHVPIAATSSVGRPLYFEANYGQAVNSIWFLARSRDGVFAFSPTETIVTLRKPCSMARQLPVRGSAPSSDTQARSVRFEFLGANPRARMTGLEKLAGTVNYFVGCDRAKWKKCVPTFARVQVEEIYPGINLVHYGNQRQLEYDFVVRPGADPRMIVLRITGADRLEVDPNGDLVLHLGGDQIRQKKPVIYQTDHDRRKEISCNYRLRDSETVVFQVGDYDREIPLVIDPVLGYSTYFGGLANDIGRAIVLDTSGNIYVAGDTLSSQLGTTAVYQSVYAGGYPGAGGDAFVAKFDATGTNLVYLTYLGGSGDDAATSIALDSEGNLYLTGVTDSTNFPIPSLTVSNRISGKGELYFGLHPYDAFVAKISPDGSQLIYATYLGGSGRDQGLGIAVDGAFCAYITGFTESKDFPITANSFQGTLQGGSDAFVTKIASNGMSIVFSTFLGGTNTDQGQSIALDSLGRSYVAGLTRSTNFPVSANAFQTNRPLIGPPAQVFVSLLETNGSALLGSTYLGGSGSAMGFHLALDASNNVYVTGSVDGPGFPITPGRINPGGIFKSEDAATNWLPSNLGLLHNEVRGIGIDPINPSNLYAGTGRGIARSTDAGASWQVSLDAFDEVVTFAIDPALPSTIYAGATEVLKSTNSGATWFSSSTGLVTSVTSPTNTLVTINKLVIDPLVSGTLYAGTLSGVFQTTNAAASWRAASQGLGTLAVKDLVMDPFDHATLLAATSTGVYRTTNSGVRWTAFSEGLTNLNADALVFDSASPPAAYVALGDSTVFRRTQGSTNWTLLSTNLINANTIFSNSFIPNRITLLASDPAMPTILYAGTRNGLFKSEDSGTNWVVVTNGLPGLPIASLALNPTSPSNLYVGTFNTFAAADAFLTKFSPDLASISFSVTFGGSGGDQAVGVVLDAEANAYVVGSTASRDFPVFQPLDYPSSLNSGLSDAFVTAIKADGSDYLFSTYLGGTGNDFGTALALDAATNVWLVGQTFSPDFPITGGGQETFLGPSDAFLAKISMTYSLVDVTLDSNPSGIGIFVDGTTNATPVMLHWPVGSFHTLAAFSQSAGTNALYAWTSWSDGGALIHNVAAFVNTNITANFKRQFFLTMSSTNATVTDTNLAVNSTNSGAISPLSGWYDEGTNISISAIAPAGGAFVRWDGVGDGSFSGLTNQASVTMNGPISETAIFGGPLTNRVKVIVTGNGTVSPNYDGQSLRVGNLYTTTATPGPGAVFSSWTLAGRQILTPKLTFLMTNGLVLEAEFIPSPFGPVAGTYAGLFFNTNVVAFQSSGFFSATVTDLGKLTARFQMGRSTFSLSSQFTAQGSLSTIVPRPGTVSLGVDLQIDLSGTSNVITGHIDGTVWTAELLANRAIYSKTNPPPLAGKKYAVLLPGAPDSLTEPGGDGYGTVAVDSSGNLSFSGKLGDGTSIAQKTFISSQSQWPFYASLYSGHGVIIGWITLTNEPESDLNGPVDWFKLPVPFTSLYPSGFTLHVGAVGSLYAFTNGVPILPLDQGNGRLVLENGKLTASITNYFMLDAANKVTSTNKMNLTFTTSSGLYTGSALDAATGKTVSFTGAVLQKQNRGAGFFRQSDQTGRVLIGP